MKYKLLEKESNGLHRIQALKSFGDVPAGDLGGQVEGMHNLSQAGNSWIYGYAEVSGNARVLGNAEVSGNAIVYENAVVTGDAEVTNNN